MCRVWALVTAQAIVTLIYVLPSFAQNNDCCRDVGRVGTCVQRTRMGFQSNGFECLPLPPRDVRRELEVVGCRSYNMAAELFGGSSCQADLPGSDVSTCRSAGDACFLIEKREKVIHAGSQRIECVKGEGLFPAAATTSSTKRIVRGECQATDTVKEY